MKFRPCIDIHNGKVKQIVGGSLLDKGDYAKDNFVSEKDGDFYAGLYKDAGLKGGHIILLNPAGSQYYEEDVRPLLDRSYLAKKRLSTLSQYQFAQLSPKEKCKALPFLDQKLRDFISLRPIISVRQKEHYQRG